MYEAIIMSDLKRKPSEFAESFNIDLSVPDDLVYPNHDQLFQEAVFTSGKQSLKEIETGLEKVKKILVEEVDKQKESEKDPDNKKPYKFNPETYWKHEEFKTLENTIQKIFGFRSVEIVPYIEKFNSKTDKFASEELNCETSIWDRYPIDGLVTDKGFYDNTHSITLMISMSCGVIYKMEPSEIVAAILHEIGHNIDPALVTITYAETNILSKYLTDRSKNLSRAEKKAIEKKKLKQTKGIGAAILIHLGVITGIFASIVAVIAFIANSIKSKLSGKDKGSSDDRIISKLKSLITEDVKSEFNRKDYTEAFADNFARMYGYGPELVRFFNKLNKNMETEINSRFKKEKKRQQYIVQLVMAGLKDDHKTDIHRIKALIKEYHNDINNPNTPENVKKQLQEDVAEVELVLNEYLNNFSEFQNKINNLINDAIDKADGKSNSNTPQSKETDKPKDDEENKDEK